MTPMRFLKVKTKSGRNVLVRVDQITTVEESGNGTLYVNTTGQHIEITHPCSNIEDMYELLRTEKIEAIHEQ